MLRCLKSFKYPAGGTHSSSMGFNLLKVLLGIELSTMFYTAAGVHACDVTQGTYIVYIRKLGRGTVGYKGCSGCRL